MNAMLNNPLLSGYLKISDEQAEWHKEYQRGQKYNEIQNLESKSLSTTDVVNLLQGKVNYVPYSDICEYSNIDQLLGEYDCCIILYFTAMNFGHYVCLTRRGDEVEFFDPYGLMIDDELDFIDKNLNYNLIKSKNQDYGYLSKLLIDSNYKLCYNQYQFQKEKKDVNTCGRHCVVRCMMKKLNLEKYRKFIKKNIKLLRKLTEGRKNIDADFVVTMFTEQI